MIARHALRFLLAVLLASTWTGAALAQAPSGGEGIGPDDEILEVRQQEDGSTDTIIRYVVRPGDTLEGLTQRFLGTPTLWKENQKLNPQIRDPNMLRLGQVLQILGERTIPAKQARILEIRRDVDMNLQNREGWIDAVLDHELFPSEGVKTGKDSSTVLGFYDNTELQLTELSVVFLRELRTTLTGVRRGQIEIESGQAEIAVRAKRADRDEIEILVGDTVARPRVGAAGIATTRARRGGSGDSQVMVYGGDAKVEAGGAEVDVARGEGTVVPQGEPPNPPEKLLPKAETEIPAKDSRWDYADPPFTWKSVEGAASYTVEVCADAPCSALLRRRTGLVETRWQPDPIPRGAWHWRVTAVAPSGLDGFPGDATAFEILSDRPDTAPPTVVALLDGPGEVTPAGRIRLRPGSSVALAARDDASGVAEVRYRWNGGPWEIWTDGVVEPPQGDGVQTLELQATDRLAKSSEVWTVEVEWDLAGPSAPEVEWTLGG